MIWSQVRIHTWSEAKVCYLSLNKLWLCHILCAAFPGLQANLRTMDTFPAGLGIIHSQVHRLHISVAARINIQTFNILFI